MIRNIVFDFGGVLIDWNPRYMYKDVFKDNSEMEFFLTNVCDSDWNNQQDAGRSFEEAIDLLLPIYPEYTEQIKLYFASWQQMIAGDIKENVEVLMYLKDKYSLFGLTNWSGETFPTTFERFSFFKEFQGIVVSGDEKLIKPDDKIFNLLLARYKLNASECVFIDDNIDNIATAKRLGFVAIHLADGIILKDEIAKLNL